MTSNHDRIDDVFDLLTGPERHILDHFAYYCLNPRHALRHADLSGVDFSGRDLNGFDFTDANLEGATFDRANIFGAHFWNTKMKHQQYVSAKDAFFCFPCKSEYNQVFLSHLISDVWWRYNEYGSEGAKKYFKKCHIFINHPHKYLIFVDNNFSIMSFFNLSIYEVNISYVFNQFNNFSELNKYVKINLNLAKSKHSFVVDLDELLLNLVKYFEKFLKIKVRHLPSHSPNDGVGAIIYTIRKG